MVLIIALLFWLLFLPWLSLNDDFSIVFDISNKDCNTNKYLFAYYSVEKRQLQYYWLEPDHLVSYPDFVKEIISQSKLNELSTTNWPSIAFLLGRLAHQQVKLDFGGEQFADCSGADAVWQDLVPTQLQLEVGRSLFEKPFLSKSKVALWATLAQAQWIEVVPPKTSKAVEVPIETECSVAVINSTPMTGYAQLVTTVLENSGMRVVKIDSDLNQTSTSEIVFNPDKDCDSIAQLIALELFSDQEKLSLQSDPDQVSLFRADIVIRLAKPFHQEEH